MKLIVRILKEIGYVFILAIICPIFISATDQPKKILIVSAEGRAYPALMLLEKGIQTISNTDSPNQFQFFYEAQDSSRIPNSKYETEMVSLLRQKYADEKIDLIFALGTPVLRLLLKHEDNLFTGVPKIYLANDRREIAGIDLGSTTTGVTGKIEFGPTVELMLAQHPSTKRIVVVSGKSRLDTILLAEARKEFDAFTGRVEFLYPTNRKMPALQNELSSLPPKTLIFYISLLEDDDGITYTVPESLSLLSPTSNAPIYGITQTGFGHGLVGGVLVSYESIGMGAAKIAQRILASERPQDIPPETAPNITMFDWRELRKWGVDENSLPAGSIVQFRVPTLWEQYIWYIAGFITLSILQSSLIGWLLFIRARRRKAEEESRRFAALAHVEHQRLDEVVANVPGIVWESRLEPGTQSRTNRFVSTYAEKMLGYPVEEWLTTPGFLFTIVLDEDRERVATKMQQIFDAGKEGVVQFRWVAKDGGVFWAEAHLAAICDQSKNPVGLRGVTMDITESKLAEEKLRARERELREAQRVSQVGSWEWDPGTGKATWSEVMYSIVGLDPTQPPPPTPFYDQASLPTTESWDLLSSTVSKALQTESPYELELEMIRTDGSHIWTIARGEVLREGDTVTVHGTLQDITERKKAAIALQKALDEVNELQRQLQQENILLKEVINLEHSFPEIIGQSDGLKYVFFKIEQVAPTDATVLISGETGTGKELVARAVHTASPRKNRPLVKVNCAALSANLIESELFGHERGSFTGASTKKIGRFELADGATIFLDEVGELPLELQVKLLRVIQEGEFERLGSSKTMKVDVRIIAATNRNLEQEVKQGNFREDLLFRLNVFPITVPPLRERKEDIPQLVEHFANRFSKKLGKTISSVSPATLRTLAQHSWPGNIRELANVIERSVINTPNEILRVLESFDVHKAENGSSASTETLETVERKYITQILGNTGWRIEGTNGAARILGLNPSTLRTRMSKLNISKKSVSTNGGG